MTRFTLQASIVDSLLLQTLNLGRVVEGLGAGVSGLSSLTTGIRVGPLSKVKPETVAKNCGDAP